MYFSEGGGPLWKP